uniref:G protein signaling modulator 2, like n=1 Tax=Oryzias melastigma TaxID=30732 RepID=A0A3B3BT79_ORYME
MESSCLDLALEGERLCKAGDYRAGVSFFEAAIQVGTEDLQILSAIYSQLGNAYFHLQEYIKALEYHRHDLTLTRAIGDEVGEAKASGNLGNTLKLLGRYDEAVVCCQRHLEITKAIYDKVGQARALYNFGNVYHAKGKSICWSGAKPGEFPEEARTALRKAAHYYEANLNLVMELGDRAAQGRTYGNLGNTYYLLGDFEAAIAAHEKRLLIAKEFGDKSAERRAHCNLGNAHIFLSQFEIAANHYKRTLQLARLLKDRAVEAQACYSLGNTYTLLQDYERAIDYHLKHLVIAQDLKDCVGEGRAYWSLGNAHTALGNHEQAMLFAEKHLEIAKRTGDKSGEMTARMNLADLRMVVGPKSNPSMQYMFPNNRINDPDPIEPQPSHLILPGKSKLDLKNLRFILYLFSGSSKSNTIKASTKLFLFQRLNSKKQKNNKPFAKDQEENQTNYAQKHQDTVGEDSFFDILSRFQSNRLDDQRCSLDSQSHLSLRMILSHMPFFPAASEQNTPSQDPGHFLERLASCQAHRLDDQRASGSHFPGLHLSTCNPPHIPSTSSTEPAPPQGSSGSRLNDQRCSAPPPKPKGPTVPNEDFFTLILRSQGNRMEEQRVPPPASITLDKPG